MYWCIGSKQDSNGDKILFYEYFEIGSDIEQMISDVTIKTVAASSEEAFLEYYQKNKRL